MPDTPSKYITGPDGHARINDNYEDPLPAIEAKKFIEKGIAKCKGNIAINARLKKYKSANAVAEAVQMDPKTIRKIERGQPVRLNLIQSYAENLNISIDTILLEEYVEWIKQTRAMLDYSDERLFHGSRLQYGSDHLPEVSESKLGQPLDGTRFAELLTQMSSDKEVFFAMPDKAPVWKIHESVMSSDELPSILEELNIIINNSVLKTDLNLSSIISRLKVHGDVQKILTRLDEEFDLHILGCEISTCCTFKKENRLDVMHQYYRKVLLPLFVIAPTTVREFNLKYKKVLHPMEVQHQFSLDNEDMWYEELKGTSKEMWEEGPIDDRPIPF
jgi:transcriptional regulator with XRE-family HTH domain